MLCVDFFSVEPIELKEKKKKIPGSSRAWQCSAAPAQTEARSNCLQPCISMN